MPEQRELVTVFRSADFDAADQAMAVRDVLTGAGMPADVFDDSAPGVPAGAFEVRVAGEQQEEAERLIEDAERSIEAEKGSTPEPADLSHDLDMVPVFASDAPDAELLTTGIRSILDAHEIPSMLVSGSMFPSLPFEVRVPKTRLEDAQRAIVAAQAAGPEAAEEGERESEEGA